MGNRIDSFIGEEIAHESALMDESDKNLYTQVVYENLSQKKN